MCSSQPFPAFSSSAFLSLTPHLSNTSSCSFTYMSIKAPLTTHWGRSLPLHATYSRIIFFFLRLGNDMFKKILGSGFGTLVEVLSPGDKFLKIYAWNCVLHASEGKWEYFLLYATINIKSLKVTHRTESGPCVSGWCYRLVTLKCRWTLFKDWWTRWQMDHETFVCDVKILTFNYCTPLC